VCVYDPTGVATDPDLVRSDAERILIAGKERANIRYPRMASSDLHSCVGERGQAGRTLEAAIPSFGRGGEGVGHDWPPQAFRSRWCPGSPQQQAAASYAGIPLTHRDYSQSVVLAHENT